MNECFENAKLTNTDHNLTKYLYFKNSVDVKFLEKVIAAGNVYETLNNGQNVYNKIED